jgi:hypothetical protein
LSDVSEKANVGRRSLLLAGTALPVLPILACGAQLQQAQAQAPTLSTAPAAGNVVRVAPTDTIATIQAKLKSVPTGGTLAFPANSAFNFNGQTIRGKNSVTVWADGVVTITGGASTGNGGKAAFDFSGNANWSVRGKAPGQGFVFNGNLVNADSATTWSVGNCIFNNQSSNGYDGSAISMNGASFGLVINNDMNNVQGATLGSFEWDNITIDGNHMIGSMQPVSINQSGNTAHGRNIVFRRNVLVGWIRAGFETGGGAGTAADPYNYFQNLTLDNNWFGAATVSPQNAAGAVSIVARAQTGTRVTNNYIQTSNVEMDDKSGTAVVTGNLIVNANGPFAYYGTPPTTTGNRLFNCTGTVPSGNTILTADPGVPPQPARMAW